MRQKRKKQKNGTRKDRAGIDEEGKRWEGPSVGLPLSSTAQILLKHTEGGHVILCWNKTRAIVMQPHSFITLAPCALKLQSASYSGRIMMRKLGSLLPVSGFITATEAADGVGQKTRIWRDKTTSGA